MRTKKITKSRRSFKILNKCTNPTLMQHHSLTGTVIFSLWSIYSAFTARKLLSYLSNHTQKSKSRNIEIMYEVARLSLTNSSIHTKKQTATDKRTTACVLNTQQAYLSSLFGIADFCSFFWSVWTCEINTKSLCFANWQPNWHEWMHLKNIFPSCNHLNLTNWTAHKATSNK